MAITEMRSKELHRLEYIVALDAQLHGGEEPLKGRLQGIPGGWDDYRMIRVKLSDLVRKLYETVPTSTLKHFHALEKAGEVVIRLKTIDARGKMSCMMTSDLRMLINTCMADECAMCLKDTADIKACPLRKTLMNVAPPVNKPGRECPYSEAAIECDLGNYV